MAEIDLDGITISYDVVGEGPPVLLLHGFPETRAMWAPVVPLLSGQFTVVTADLRGYGASSKPAATRDHSNYSFRAMGEDMARLMTALGHARFHLVGHDRGARVAYRMALDHPERVDSLSVLDIVPTDHLVDTWDYPISKPYFHWSFLVQPAPFPERMIEADPDHFFEACLMGWGGAKIDDFPAIEVYRAAWRDPAAIAAMTNDYRAGATIDLAHDRADEGRQLDCPALVLYGSDGVMARTYDVGAVWKERLGDMTCKAIAGGHFFIDQNPNETAGALKAHLAG